MANVADVVNRPVEEAHPGNGAAGGRERLLPHGDAGYVPLVPTFSPHTADALRAVKLAWRATVLAFATLVFLAIAIPAARNWYVRSAVEPQVAQTMTIDGAVFVRRQDAGDWVAIQATDQVAPGDVVRTAANARAFMRLFDQSTVLLYPSSTLRILRAEQGRFQREKKAIVLELSQGTARFGIAPAAVPEDAFVQLRTPHAAIHLQEGSYSADVTKAASQVSVRIGEATAYAPRGAVGARTAQRLVVPADRAPLGNQPARRDLVDDGLFAATQGNHLAGWTDGDRSEQDPPGTVSLAAIPGAVAFERHGEGHGETLVSQPLDIDLWDFEKVTLAANLRVLEHSLSGGGWQGTEYPIMLRLVYRDATGGVSTWYRGFYLHNEDNHPVRDGVQLPSTDWQQVEIDLLSLAPRPWHLQRVDVVAEGWDYRSAIKELHIWAE